MKRILFVDAGDPYTKLQDRFYPLWPGYLAHYVEKHLGTDKFKFRLLKFSIKKAINSFKPHLVAISSVSINYNQAIKCASISKNFGLPVIIGGIHISNLPQTLTKDMDVGCISEGIETFMELMRHYLDYGEFQTQRLGDIKGIVYHDNGSLKLTPSRPIIRSLDELPHPKRSIIGHHRSATMITSRGCPYRCIFCSVSRYWDKISYSSPEYVMEEIDELIYNGTKIIRFYDDLFTSNKKRLKILADKIVEKGYHQKVKFACWARANTITPEVIDILKSMNMVAVEMGLESGCERTLKYLKGGNVTVEQNRLAVKLLKKAGIQANGDFIIGAPDETEEEIMQTYNFIKEIRLDTVTVNPLTPYPGTPVWEYAIKRSLVSCDMDWSKIKSVKLSEKLNEENLSALLKRFHRLSLINRLKALPRSPWLVDAPRIIALKLAGKTLKFGNSLAKTFH